MEIVIDPYVDMTEGNAADFQPYKYSTALLYLIRDVSARVTLVYPVKVMKHSEHKHFLIESMKGFYRTNGDAELKKWRIILQLEDGEDTDLARELQQILMKIGLTHVNIMLTGING